MSQRMTKATNCHVRPASAQPNQSLCYALNRTQAIFMRTAKTDARLGGCPG